MPMHSATANCLAVFVLLLKHPAADDAEGMQFLKNKVGDSLFDRTLKALPLHHANLDETTLNKPSRLASHRPAGYLSTRPTEPGNRFAPLQSNVPAMLGGPSHLGIPRSASSIYRRPKGSRNIFAPFPLKVSTSRQRCGIFCNAHNNDHTKPVNSTGQLVGRRAGLATLGLATAASITQPKPAKAGLISWWLTGQYEFKDTRTAEDFLPEPVETTPVGDNKSGLVDPYKDGPLGIKYRDVKIGRKGVFEMGDLVCISFVMTNAATGEKIDESNALVHRAGIRMLRGWDIALFGGQLPYAWYNSNSNDAGYNERINNMFVNKSSPEVWQAAGLDVPGGDMPQMRVGGKRKVIVPPELGYGVGPKLFYDGKFLRTQAGRRPFRGQVPPFEIRRVPPNTTLEISMTVRGVTYQFPTTTTLVPTTTEPFWPESPQKVAQMFNLPTDVELPKIPSKIGPFDLPKPRIRDLTDVPR